MIVKITELKPNPINDEIYSPTDLTDLKSSIKQNGLLEPICCTKQMVIISGHRRYYALKQLKITECEVSVKEYQNEIIGLIEHNRARQKTASDVVKEVEFLTKEYKKQIGQGKRTDLTGEKVEHTHIKVSKLVGVSLSNQKKLKSINNYEPELLLEIDGGKLSINKAYVMVRDKYILKDKKFSEKDNVMFFKRSFTQLLKKYEPPLELIQSVVDGVYPYSREKAVKSENTKDKTLSKFDTKREELINHLEFLKKMDINMELLYKKQKEIEVLNFPKKLKDKVHNNIWMPSDLKDKLNTIEEIDGLEPILEIVDSSNDEFNCLRVNISSMGYNVNPGRHIRIIVKDKKSKKYLGVITLASDFSNLGVRDTEIGWSDDNKFTDKKLNHTAIASSIVPTQPFGFNFLGGKLLACLTTTKIIRDYWKKKYGDTLIGNTTTALYGNFSMYNSIPHWKKIGLSKGKFLLHPSSEHYQFWLDYIKENYRKEYEKAVSRTSPKQHILNLIYKILGIDAKRYENEFQRGVYLSMFYKNGKEFLRNEIDEDCLVLNELFQKDIEGIMEWWKPKAIRRYENVYKKGKLNEHTLWLDNIRQDDIEKYLSVKGLYEE